MTTWHWLGLLLLAVFAGAVVPFQSAINANLGRGLGHPLWATLASLTVSILVLLPVILALRLPLPSMAFITQAPMWMWAGGAFGVCFIALALILTGQILASLLLDHFGLFGLVERHLTAPRLLGVLMLIGGVALIQFSAAPAKALAAAG